MLNGRIVGNAWFCSTKKRFYKFDKNIFALFRVSINTLYIINKLFGFGVGIVIALRNQITDFVCLLKQRCNIIIIGKVCVALFDKIVSERIFPE